MEPTPIVTAIITASGPALAVWLRLRSVERKFDTNHGKTPGQYLEMIAVVDDRTQRIEDKVDDHSERIAVLEDRTA